MPYYDYSCPACEHTWDVIKSMNDASNPESCPKCGAIGQRIFSPPALKFGPGTYTYDNQKEQVADPGQRISGKGVQHKIKKPTGEWSPRRKHLAKMAATKTKARSH